MVDRKILNREKYLLVYFKGEYEKDGEQVYFAISEDGLNWEDINSDKPVLMSNLGEGGIRDPFIIRSDEGDKFYIIATDLKIYGNGNWEKAQNDGSQSIVIWESSDLVNWSKQRNVRVALDSAGCTWAPEAIYDDSRQEYIVFWASRTPVAKNGKDEYQRMYYSTTKDFYEFTEAKLWSELKDSENNLLSVIDSTVTKVDDTYYRFTKNETEKYVYLERSNSLLGEWTRVYSEMLKSQRNVEGPICFELKGENKWCLLLDNYSAGGYYPLISSSLEEGVFEKIHSNKYNLPHKARHGSVMAITDLEFERLKEKISVN